ncbi:MAG: hypothetical protein K1X68_00205 [Saprospiraceae bacterium]|nr:hypothetical protein [Saprospiraceae bacterium]HMW38873.1 hypothetical protein [Saprospiraceae bacterium]HMX86935.1 hypothetical protein [Saprospiraceae bacterium]HMZ39885.1 hypothetical protein [Saprospiraceae bacterium]HNA65674.1 hypothetical protein [Saprospiraceae bacterium]
MKFSNLVAFLGLILLLGSCSSGKIRSANLRIASLENEVQKCRNLDSLRKVEAAEKLHISRQLDKTERVLAQLYLQLPGLSPKNLKESTSQNLNADIAQQNIMLVIDTTRLRRENDSLRKQIEKSTETTVVSSNTKTKVTGTKSFDSQKKYIEQLEASNKAETDKNNQLQRSLNAYSLKLEIMDNERIHAINNARQENARKTDSLEHVIADLQLANEQYRTSLVALKDKPTPVKDDKKSQKEEVKRLNLLLDRMRDENKLLSESNKQLSTQSNQLKRENEGLNNKIQTLTHESEEIRKNVLLDSNTNTQKVSALEQTLKLNQLRIKELENCTLSTQSENKTLREQINLLNSKATEYEKNNQAKENHEVQLKEEISKLREQNILTENKIQTLSEQKKELMSRIEEQNQVIVRQQEQILDLSKKASKNKNTDNLTLIIDSLRNKNAMINQLQKQIDSIRQINTEKSSSYQTLLLAKDQQISALELQKSTLEANVNALNKRNAVLEQDRIAANPDNQKTSKKEVEKEKKPSPAKDKTASNLTDERLLTRVRELISEVKWPGITAVKTEKKIILTVPQSAMFLNETSALTSGGATLIQKLSNITHPLGSRKIDIISFSDPGQEEDELNLKRSNTIGKLMIAYGLPAASLNFGTRSYHSETDTKLFSKGTEIIISTE